MERGYCKPLLSIIIIINIPILLFMRGRTTFTTVTIIYRNYKDKSILLSMILELLLLNNNVIFAVTSF